MKIIVLGLPRETSENDLTALFSSHGEVESCSIVMDKEKGTSKGFGFVEMNDKQGQSAIKALHNTKIGKNRIRVKDADKS